MIIRRIDRDFSRWDEVLDLILTSFAYMNGRIDPPSSALTLTAEALAEKAEAEIGYVVLEEQFQERCDAVFRPENGNVLEGETLLGCVFLRPEPNCLYVGKLAVAPAAQGRGVGRRLMAVAEETARGLNLPELRLDVRIELTGNQAVFAAWGFEKTAERAHPGYDRITQIEMRKSVARLRREA